MDPDPAVADEVESNAPAPAEGAAPTETHPLLLVREEEKGIGKPFSK